MSIEQKLNLDTEERDRIWAERYLPGWAQSFFHGEPAPIERYRNNNFYVSPRLQENPTAQLDLMTEIDEFLAQQTYVHTQITQSLYEQMGSFPLPKSPKAAMVTLVDLDNDLGKLKHDAMLLAQQDMPPSEWMVLFLINQSHTSKFEEKKLEEAATAIIKAEKLHGTFPWAMSFFSRPPQAGVGALRTWGCGAIMRHLQAQRVSHDVIGLSHDVDSVAIPPYFVRRYAEALEANPHKDIFSCRTYWQPIGPYESDANKVLRYWQFAMEAVRHRINYVYLPDANVGFRMSTYAATGGYKPAKKEESYWLQRFIAAARHDDRDVIPTRQALMNVMHFDPYSFLRTDSRRIAHALANGIAPPQTWNEIPFSVHNDKVRSEPVPTVGALDVRRMCDEIDTANFDYIHAVDTDYERTARTQRQARHILGIR